AGGGASAPVVPVSGQLGATIDLRDTIIPGYKDKVDALASAIVETVNIQHKVGVDLNGVTVVNFFDPAGTTAATITLNPAIISTTQIAASGNPLIQGDNSNALAMAK